MSLNAVMEQLRARAESDPAFADTLHHLVKSDLEDPYGTAPDDLRGFARQVNRGRQADRIEELRARSLTSSEVVDLLATVSDRKGVDRRRHRGTLLGIRDGNRTLHPDWQFDRRRRETHEGLGEVLGALREVAGDELDADAIAVASRDEFGGASVADLLADGDVDGAVRLAYHAGDQS